MWKTVTKQKHDVARWRAAGWVTAEGERHILADIDASTRSLSAAAVFAILGAVLFGFAAMSFVAANWDEMSRLARLALLISAMLAAYGLAGVTFARGLQAFGHAATLLGVSLFGADIMLISQMYHIDGHPPDAVLMWAIGAAAAGVLINSNPASVLALLLVCLWSGWESHIMAERSWPLSWSQRVSAVHWPFLPALAAVSAPFVWRGYRPGLELAALALAIWMFLLGFLVERAPEHRGVVAAGLAAAAAAVAVPWARGQRDAVAQLVASRALVYASAVVAAGIFIQQFGRGGGKSSDASFSLWAASLLAFSATLIWYGLSAANRDLVRLGYVVFSVEIVTIYFRTVGTLMGSAAFFLSAGLLMIGLAAFSWRLERAVAAAPVAANPGAMS